MDGTTITLVIIGCIMLVVLGTVWAIYNSIVGNKNAVKRSWATVLTYQRMVMQVLPKLEENLKDYREYEEGLQSKITELRSAASSLRSDSVDAGKLEGVEEQMKQLLGAIKITVEAYPELKTAEVTQQFMREISEQESNVAAAITIFNSNVQRFNDGIQMFPNNLVNNWLNREKEMTTFTDSKAAAEIEFSPAT